MTIKEALYVGFPLTEEMKSLQIVNRGTTNEYYIDCRTEYEKDFNYKVRPVSANPLAYLICCPNCGKLHPFPRGWSDQKASNLLIDHVVVPEMIEFDEDGKRFQITVIDFFPMSGMSMTDIDPAITEAFRMFWTSNNPKVQEAYNLLFPEFDYSDSIDPDGKPVSMKNPRGTTTFPGE